MNTDTTPDNCLRSRVHTLPYDVPGSPQVAVLEPASAEQAAAEAYSELCAKVVHAFNNDLRTPLTTLLCHTELLLETEALPDVARRSLDAMRRAGQTIRKRLTDVAVSIDAHDGESGRGQVHLASLLRAMVAGSDSGPSGPEISLTTSGTEELLVVGYPALLRRGVAALLDNALDNAPEGSTVWLSSRVEADEVCIEVRDEGPGLSERERERQAASSATGDDASRLRGGGLAIASCVAAAHSGRLVLSNLPDGGCSATLRLDLRTVSGS